MIGRLGALLGGRMGEGRSLGVGGGESLMLGVGANPCGARPKVSTRFSRPGRVSGTPFKESAGKIAEVF